MIFHVLFGWWLAIWPNLAASVLWAAPAFIHLHVRLSKIERLGRREGGRVVPGHRDNGDGIGS